MLNIYKINVVSKIAGLLFFTMMLVGLSGCFGSYGRIMRNPELTEAFQNNEIPQGYKYYYYGDPDKPYAVAGVDPKYEVRSKLWREVDPKSENRKFKKMIYWMWADYGYYPYGAHILDPSGNKVGSWYSSIYFVAVKFSADHRIMLMPETPFLWGPTANASGTKRLSTNMVR
ncbi:MAG: hypothetical protein PVI06_17590 [Desulfobacterales bacterium]|jgi:hypothetical protein